MAAFFLTDRLLSPRTVLLLLIAGITISAAARSGAAADTSEVATAQTGESYATGDVTATATPTPTPTPPP